MAEFYTVNVNGKLILQRDCLPYIYVIIAYVFLISLAFLCGGVLLFVAVVDAICRSEFESKYKNTNQNTTEYEKNATIYLDNCMENRCKKTFDYLQLGFLYFVLIFLICTGIDALRRFFRSKSLIAELKLNFKLAKTLRKKKKSYLNPSSDEIRASRLMAKNARLYVSKLLFEDLRDVLPDLNHQNLMPNPAVVVNHYHIYYDLKKFMFLERWQVMPGNLPPLTDIVIYIKDVLEGLQYLHDHQVYHLNICPENILIVSFPNRHSGIAKITGFDHALKTDQRIAEYQKVGLEWIYRPPEYYAKGNVDAAAVDYWSVGITAYETLTGGMITIYSATLDDQRIHKMIEKEKMLELSFLSSSVQASWKYTQLLQDYDAVVEIENVKYNMAPKGFLKDIWMFVNALMHNNPKQRSNITEALNAPFITKSLNPNLKHSSRCSKFSHFLQFFKVFHSK